MRRLQRKRARPCQTIGQESVETPAQHSKNVSVSEKIVRVAVPLANYTTKTFASSPSKPRTSSPRPVVLLPELRSSYFNACTARLPTFALLCWATGSTIATSSLPKAELSAAFASLGTSRSSLQGVLNCTACHDTLACINLKSHSRALVFVV
eukprot:3364730-Pleurochrysis_carterae.AAC.2